MKKSALFFIGCLVLSLACNLGVPAPGTESPLSATPLSSPVPDAATQAVLVIETASITPEPPPPYFTEEFDIPSPYWKFLQTGGNQMPSTSIEGGSLRVTSYTSDNWLVAIFVIHSYSNVFVRAKTSINPTGSTGLVCRYNEAVGWYEFNIASDGTYSVLFGRWLSPGIAEYIPIAGDRSKLLEGSLSHEIGLSCQEGFISLHIDRTLVRRVDVTNYGLIDGHIGIAVAAFAETPITALFDWVSVSSQ